MEAKTILIVEDDDSIAGLIVETIHQETQHVALRATDAVHAQKVIDLFIPNLLILDYNLPGMNGIELYDSIHALHDFVHIPAFIVTAHQTVCAEDAKKRCLPCLKKPFELEDFLNTIESLIE